jgi:hypothetical protein
MKDKAYWKALTERYFDAETTRKEEDALKAFAASTTDPDFDELRAVMGYLAVGRKQYASSEVRTKQPATRRIALYARVAAAAIFLLIALPWGYRQWQYQQENICVAYVNGERLTDDDEVMRLMKETLLTINDEEPETIMEKQLSDLFHTIE